MLKRALPAIGALALLASCVAPAPPPPSPVHWLLYGDSLSQESAPYLAQYGSVGNRWSGGTAPCDWTANLASDAATWAPQEVLIQFSGNQLTLCSQGDGYTIYLNSVGTLATFWQNRGVPVVIVISPPKPDGSEAFAANAELQVAANLGLSVNRADQTVLSNGAFTSFLPCRTPAEDGCGTDPMGQTPQPGMIRVRSTDGIHFGVSSVSGYSSGAFRFAAAESQPILRTQ